ncbi:MAG: N-acetylmuramoyl-L-alanine amidase [Planctomycetes bacterium]|nr:N-acetylmuramoyl-L-alanine amidase [Planctomycetota bacterium]
MRRPAAPRPSRRRRVASPGVSRRTKVVWTALLATMTVVATMLGLAENGRLPALSGLSLPPLVAAAGPSSIESVHRTRAPTDRQRWRAIVIHHSGSPLGTPQSIAADHVNRLHLTGLGYHFVIGNGRGIQDGEIYVAYRWLDQLPGAHTAGKDADWYNRHSIGICLVGDGRRHPFTESQLRRLVQLVRSLAREYDIPADRILLHSDLVETSDPGPLFPAAAFRAQIASTR